MTTYSAVGYSSGSPGSIVAVKAVNYEVRIIRVDLNSWDNNAHWTYGRRHVGSSTFTGGSLVTPSPSRAGAPAASALVRGGSISTSGTTQLLSVGYLSQGAVGVGTSGDTYPGATLTIQYASTTTIAPGSAFSVYTTTVISGDDTWVSATLYFEELRLAGCS